MDFTVKKLAVQIFSLYMLICRVCISSEFSDYTPKEIYILSRLVSEFSDDTCLLIDIYDKYRPRGPLNVNSFTVLAASCANGDEEAVRMLIKHGANVNGRAKAQLGMDATVFEMLILRERSNVDYPCGDIPDNIRVKMTHLLLELGGDVNSKRFHGRILNFIIRNFSHLGDPVLELVDDAIAHGANLKGSLDFVLCNPPLYDVPDELQEKLVHLLLEHNATIG